MSTAQEPTAIIAFPPGHPHHGRTIKLNGVQFTDGKAELPISHAEPMCRVLTPYYGAAIEGTDAYTELEAQYAPMAEETARANAERDARAMWELEEAARVQAEAEAKRVEQEAARVAAEEAFLAKEAEKHAAVAASKEAAAAASAASAKPVQKKKD